MNIVALVPAYNEEKCIANTITALLNQRRVPDRIVIIPNGCSDKTAGIARAYPVTVLELPRLEHKKSEALNIAWNLYAKDADIVICLDADTMLPENAVQDWEQEFLHNEKLGGSSSKFTMPGKDFLTRLQRAEFSKWTDTSLARGWTSVLAGTGCAILGEVLRAVVQQTGREGPWSYESQVEDFELTYQIRKLGYICWVSPTVRAYTESMKTVKALWNQRMKWQVGTVEDLLSIGINRLTLLDWFQQFSGIFMALFRFLWILVVVLQFTLGIFRFHWLWCLAVPVLFLIPEVYAALRIPHRDAMDVVYAFIIPSEVFAWLRAAWFIAGWVEALAGKYFGKRKDRWQLQHIAEGLLREEGR